VTAAEAQRFARSTANVKRSRSEALIPHARGFIVSLDDLAKSSRGRRWKISMAITVFDTMAATSRHWHKRSQEAHS
jgi:hypothetical protein